MSFDEQKLVRSRAKDLASSTWFTYNQFYKAANFYKFLAIIISVSIVSIGGILTYSLIWDYYSMRFMVFLAISVSVLSGLELVVKPRTKHSELAEYGHRYQVLFDDVADFLTLNVFSEEDAEYLTSRYDSLQEKRKELNGESPNLSSLWYWYIKLIKDEEGMQQVFSEEIDDSAFGMCD